MIVIVFLGLMIEIKDAKTEQNQLWCAAPEEAGNCNCRRGFIDGEVDLVVAKM